MVVGDFQDLLEYISNLRDRFFKFLEAIATKIVNCLLSIHSLIFLSVKILGCQGGNMFS